MLLTNKGAVRLIVYDKEFNRLGEVGRFSSLIWPTAYNDYSTFELNVPNNKENIELLKEGNIIFPAGKNNDRAAFIEIVKGDRTEDGVKKLNIKGRTLESILLKRIVWGTVNYTNKNPSTIAYDLVDKCFINPENEKRKISYLRNAKDKMLGSKITYQKTGNTVYDAVKDLFEADNLGFRCKVSPEEKIIEFEVVQEIDKTINSDSPIVLSTDTQDIKTDSYYINIQDEKNVALVAGEGEGVERKTIIVGNDSLSGMDRNELYIDARDLQSENEDTGTTMTNEEYENLLKQRGEDRLSENARIESYECELYVPQLGKKVRYKYGESLFVGDKVTVVDKELNIKTNILITECKECFSTSYSVEFTLGYEPPSMYRKIKRDMT